MGDPACWLDRVCLECGRLLEDEHASEDRCPHCGAEFVIFIDRGSDPRAPSKEKG